MLPLVPQDKANHALYGAVIGALAAVICLALGYRPLAQAAAPLAAALVGGVKELYDRVQNERAVKAGLPPPHGVEVNDWLFTAFGGIFVGLVLLI